MNITIQSLKDSIKRHLSVIGKRLYDKNGNNMFSNITVSTAEDPILEQYAKDAAQTVEAMCRQLVTEFTLTDSSISITFQNTRQLDDFDTRAAELVKTYIITEATGEYLAMTHPDIAQKYERDGLNAMNALITFVFHKQPPSVATSSPLDISTSVQDEEIPTEEDDNNG